jgi:glucokinase
VEAATGLPTFLERDTNVAALAEMTYGAGRGIDDFLYFTVSTGVGAAIVSEGRLLYGPDGMAGELGHMQVDLDGPPCGCGGVGHVEALASGRAIALAARQEAAAGRSPYLTKLAAAGSIDSIGARDVAAGEEAGDLVCRDILSSARRAFSAACTSAVNVFNPTRIVVGGSVAYHQGDRLLQPARDAVAIGTFRIPGRRVTIVPAELGPDVSLAGAYRLVTSRLNMHPGPQEVRR